MTSGRSRGGGRTAVWGLGEEGRSVVRHLRRRQPDRELWVLVDDAEPSDDARRWLADQQGVYLLTGGEALAELPRFDRVVKSPGISLYRPEVARAREAGVVFTSATQIWFDEHPDARVVCVTGTKGKSTTVSLLERCLQAAGLSALAAGNIGRPALGREPEEAEPQVWVLEVSSYQAADLDACPTAAVLLNLYPEHLTWHGSVERYYRDKLRLFRRLTPGAAILNRADRETARYTHRFQQPVYFHDPAGFHVAEGWIREGRRRWLPAAELALPGAHNLGNALAALAAARLLGAPIERCIQGLTSFAGLPHRLQRLGERDGVLWVDDSISTIPQSSAAAVAAFPDREVTLLLGGHDRGLDYRELADMLVARQLHAVVTLPESGPRIARAIREARGGGGQPRLVETSGMAAAVAAARELTPPGGVVLLSPAAASFGSFRDYRERGLAFRVAAGFSSPNGDPGSEPPER